MQQRTLSLPAVAVPGIVAGLTGAILIDAYLIVTQVFIAHTVGLVNLYQYVASAAIGQAAYSDPNSVYLGVVLHVLIGMAWGVGYAFVAAQKPEVRTRPLVSGIAFGLVVMLAMQLVEVAANIYHLPTALALLNSLIAHVVFFGIPVAYIVQKRLA